MLNKPKLLLRLEGASIFALCIFMFLQFQGTASFFIVFLIPDLTILAYLAGARIGAIIYNLAHTLTGPILLAGIALKLSHYWLLPYALVWGAHIGLDRMIGFGLKYPTRFKDTHLHRV